MLGLEIIPEAVKDAKANAELNKIENCDFFTGKAEDILASVLARTKGTDVIAIVDPPRAGLRKILLNNMIYLEPIYGAYFTDAHEGLCFYYYCANCTDIELISGFLFHDMFVNLIKSQRLRFLRGKHHASCCQAQAYCEERISKMGNGRRYKLLLFVV